MAFRIRSIFTPITDQMAAPCCAPGQISKVALIGPGVDASHNYERTHIDGLTATTQWILVTAG